MPVTLPITAPVCVPVVLPVTFPVKFPLKPADETLPVTASELITLCAPDLSVLKKLVDARAPSVASIILLAVSVRPFICDVPIKLTPVITLPG